MDSMNAQIKRDDDSPAAAVRYWYACGLMLAVYAVVFLAAWARS
jgi:hypothetical protein